jgi:hypothetical protein
MDKKKLKIGLDIHGIIDAEPELFSKITKCLKENDFEIHILTGSHITDKIISELKSYNIIWDELFSISDYHKEIGTEMWYDENGNPWVSDLDWDKTKGDYCKRNNIDLHIDDTPRYEEYFETKFIYLNLKDKDIDYRYVDMKELSTAEDLEKWIKIIFLSTYEFL